jgi:shikimate dehydrogenase
MAMTASVKPRAACLIGWPAAHSRSPLIHHYWLRQLGIEGGYNIEAVPP